MMMHHSTNNPITAQDVAKAVDVRTVIIELGGEAQKHHRRASCVLCEGNSKFTVSYTADGRWFCHRCATGGDIFTLVQAATHCGFKEALSWVARTAGIELGDTHTGQLHRRLEHERRKRERERSERQQREEVARENRLQSRDELHLYERICDRALEKLDALGIERAGSEEADRAWELAAGAFELARTAEGAYWTAAEMER